MHDPWPTTGRLIDHVREVAPRHAYAIHDGTLGDTGLATVGGLLGANGPGIGAPPASASPSVQASAQPSA
ncbi:hypothetical protein [Streptomyces sp. NPDC001759]